MDERWRDGRMEEGGQTTDVTKTRGLFVLERTGKNAVTMGG